MNAPESAPPLRCGDFDVCPQTRRLLRDGLPLRIGSRAFDLLLALMAHPGRPLSAEELRRAVWPGRRIGDNNLHVHFSQLRKLLGPLALVNLPGRGWRLALPVGANAEASAAEPPPGNLPEYLPPLIGRERSTAELVAALRHEQRMTLAGPGGIGKSVLALAAAQGCRDAFADGLWCVELAPLREPALLLPAVLAALRLEPKRIGTPAALAQALAGKRLLLVLDNCEHLAGAATALCDALLLAAPGVTVLASSQVALKCAGERLWPVPPLDLPDEGGLAAARRSGALALFEARARASDPRFALTAANVEAAVQVCRRLDGVPLALQLAAARVAVLGVAGLLERLDGRLHWRAPAAADAASARHLSLQAALDWSCALLSGAEQKVLRRLGVFAGSFGLDAVQALVTDAASGPGAVLDALAVLVDHGLVMTERATLLGGTAASPRYTLHETVRLYACQRLAEDADHPRLYAAHARHFLRLADAERRRNRAHAGAGPIGFAADLDNLRSAIAWSSQHDVTLALALCAACTFYWRCSGQHQEALRLAARLLATPPSLEQAHARADFLVMLCGIDHEREAFDSVLARTDEALALLQGHDEPAITGSALSWQGTVWAMRRQLQQAESLFREASARLRGPQLEVELGKTLNNLGWTLQAQGRNDEAARVLDESIALHRRMGMDWGLCVAHENLGELAYGLARFVRAQRHWEIATATARRLDHRYRIAINLVLQSMALREMGLTARARACLREALQIADEQGFDRLLADGYSALAAVLSREGRPGPALSLLHAAQALRDRRGFQSIMLVDDEHRRSFAAALARLDEFARHDARRTGERLDVMQALAWATGAAAPAPAPAPAAPGASVRPAAIPALR